ncbi:MAG: efflux RND transporter periplasmic adaptor subunit [Candidatus Moranbacteria bacterium]|nr:efflux RND transporter periplasmic adaptor subunit [Candidatus Moranbacteria bacterium]
MNKKIIFLVGIVLIGGYFSSQVFGDEKKEETVFKNVRVSKIENKDVLSTRDFSGVVKAENETMISPKISGYVLEMKKKEGDFVRKGEVLAVIDGDDVLLQNNVAFQNVNATQKVLKEADDYYSQLVSETRAAVAVSKKEYLSVKNDSSASDSEIAIAKKGYEQAQESLDSAKKAKDLQLESAKANLTAVMGQASIFQNQAQKTSVVAPYSGVITRKMANIGDMVSPSRAVYEIAVNEKKEVEIFVPALLARNLQVGQAVSLVAESQSEKVEGKIVAISPSADRLSRKASVRISVENDLILGEFVVVSLPSGDALNAIVVEKKAVVSEYYDKFVFVLEDGVVRKKKVELGQESGEFVEVLSGANESDEVVTEGQFYLRDRDLVKVITN